MNRIKFQYTGTNSVEFFTRIKGMKVTLLQAKIKYAEINEIKRLRQLALVELESLDRAMQFVKQAA